MIWSLRGADQILFALDDNLRVIAGGCVAQTRLVVAVLPRPRPHCHPSVKHNYL